uniref:Uncharacterized protein n=1 Tax=Oryza meridionalis TaxID=40149 RepID=A0A0E0E134_9ORYZ
MADGGCMAAQGGLEERRRGEAERGGSGWRLGGGAGRLRGAAPALGSGEERRRNPLPGEVRCRRPIVVDLERGRAIDGELGRRMRASDNAPPFPWQRQARAEGERARRRRDLGSSPPSTAARAPSPSATIICYRRRHSGSSPPSGLVAATRACHRHPLSLGLRPYSSQPLPAVAVAGSSRAGSTGREKSISNVGPTNGKAIWAGQIWPLREEFGQSFGLALLLERPLE